jgi:tRNA-2-methylthio-N6-dimethylallyladenosine synthase
MSENLTQSSAEVSHEGDRPSLFVKTFGCQMNEYDTEKIYEIMGRSHVQATSPETADVVIVNTCSVREKGEHKLLSYIGELREIRSLRGKSRPLTIGVGGCVAQQEGQSLLKRSQGIDFIVGTHNLSLIPSLIENRTRGFAPQIAVDYREEWEDLPEAFDGVEVDGASLLPRQVRALVAIQRGCNKRCSFCVVPTTRGPEVSRDPVEILREVRRKARAGAKEILLLGQTVNSYGGDLSPRYPFEKLVIDISEVEGVERIRFTSPHPQSVSRGFIELYGSIQKLVPHIHLPLQSGSDRVLKLMNRNYRMRRYYEIVDALRERLPNIAVTSDFIVGFPTETEEDFGMTLEAISRVKYDTSFYFKYSPRPNTVAEAQYSSDEQIDPAIVDVRFQRLHSLQNELSQQKNGARIGTVVVVLVEARSQKESCWKGRIPENTIVEFHAESSETESFIGNTMKVLVTTASPHALKGKLV